MGLHGYWRIGAIGLKPKGRKFKSCPANKYIELTDAAEAARSVGKEIQTNVEGDASHPTPRTALGDRNPGHSVRVGDPVSYSAFSFTSTFAPGEFPLLSGWYIISAWAAGCVKVPPVVARKRK